MEFPEAKLRDSGYVYIWIGIQVSPWELCNGVAPPNQFQLLSWVLLHRSMHLCKGPVVSVVID